MSEFSWSFFLMKILLLFMILIFMTQSVSVGLSSIKSESVYYFKIF